MKTLHDEKYEYVLKDEMRSNNEEVDEEENDNDNNDDNEMNEE